MNLLLLLSNRLKFRKILIMVNLFVMLSITSSVNANIILFGDGWDGPGQGAFDVKYFFGDMTTDNGLLENDIHSAFLIAFDAWSNATNNNLTFTETFNSGENNSIDISFNNLAHGDGFPFGSGALAHAFYPDDIHLESIAGDLHMNDEGVSWEIGNGLGSSAFDITIVAVHEIGHSIGLGHSNPANSGNIMDQLISSTDTFSALSAEDINAVCSLYLCSSVQVPEPSTLGLILLSLFAIKASTSTRIRK